MCTSFPRFFFYFLSFFWWNFKPAHFFLSLMQKALRPRKGLGKQRTGKGQKRGELTKNVRRAQIYSSSPWERFGDKMTDRVYELLHYRLNLQKNATTTRQNVPQFKEPQNTCFKARHISSKGGFWASKFVKCSAWLSGCKKPAGFHLKPQHFNDISEHTRTFSKKLGFILLFITYEMPYKQHEGILTG